MSLGVPKLVACDLPLPGTNPQREPSINVLGDNQRFQGISDLLEQRAIGVAQLRQRNLSLSFATELDKCELRADGDDRALDLLAYSQRGPGRCALFCLERQQGRFETVVLVCHRRLTSKSA